MANPLKGEVEFTALGQQWRAVLDTEAKIAVEDHYGKGFISIIMDALGEDAADEQAPVPPAKDASKAEQLKYAAALRDYMNRKFQRMRIGYARTVLFESVKQLHPDVTRPQASAMIDELGEGTVAGLLTDLFTRAAPKGDGADPAASAEGKASPAPKPKPKRTGRRA